MLTTPNAYTSPLAVILRSINASGGMYAIEPHCDLYDDVVVDAGNLPVLPVDANINKPKSANYNY